MIDTTKRNERYLQSSKKLESNSLTSKTRQSQHPKACILDNIDINIDNLLLPTNILSLIPIHHRIVRLRNGNDQNILMLILGLRNAHITWNESKFNDIT